MPLRRFLKGSTLEPEQIEMLNRAYASALRYLSLVDRNDPLTEMVAKKIIEIGTTIGGDPEEIAKAAVAGLRFP
jgi:hypothetical protein